MAKGFKLSQIKFDDRNANKHNAFGMQQLENSIEQNGVIEAVTISSDNVAISGNARTEKFYQKGLEDCTLIETDGTKPVVIKRTDIKSNSKKFYNAALAANVVAKNNIVMDAEVVDAICEEYDIEEWKECNVNHASAPDDRDYFSDAGIESKNQYGVIVMCENEGNQESVFRDLTNMGFKCKVVVT